MPFINDEEKQNIAALLCIIIKGASNDSVVAKFKRPLTQLFIE